MSKTGRAILHKVRRRKVPGDYAGEVSARPSQRLLSASIEGHGNNRTVLIAICPNDTTRFPEVAMMRVPLLAVSKCRQIGVVVAKPNSVKRYSITHLDRGECIARASNAAKAIAAMHALAKLGSWKFPISKRFRARVMREVSLRGLD